VQNGVQLKIEYVSTETLVPFRGNPRKISPSGLAKLQRSVEEFGFVNPILAQRGTNMIIAGHQRLKAAQAAGLAEVPVVWLDMDDTTAKAYNIADNRLQDEAEWDKRLLADLLQDIDTGDVDLTSTGMDDDEITALLAADYGPVDIEAYLDELDISSAIGKPIWAVIRASAEHVEIVERVLVVLEQNNIRVERSYDTGA
jgi:ParB-like chromosome segregation protein Spo0J